MLNVSNLPSEVPESVIEQLKSGNKAVVEQAILGYTRLALSIAGRWMERLGYHEDELEGAALVALVKAVNDCVTQTPENPTGYVKKAINNGVCEAINALSVVSVPRSTRRYKESPPEVTCVGNPEVAVTHPDTLEINDEIDRLARDDLERAILRLRLCGFSDSEIAKRIETYPMRVCRIRQAIAQRLLSGELHNDRA